MRHIARTAAVAALVGALVTSAGAAADAEPSGYVTITGTIVNARETRHRIEIHAYLAFGDSGFPQPEMGATTADPRTGAWSLELPQGSYFIAASDGAPGDVGSTLEPRYLRGEPYARPGAAPFTMTSDQLAPDLVLPRRDGLPSSMQPGSVSISGDAIPGGTLTAVVTDWYPSSAVLEYRWIRNGVELPVSTSTITTSTADAGAGYAVGVTGTRAGFAPASATAGVTIASAAPATATATGSIIAPDLASSDRPLVTIAGRVRVGRTLVVRVTGLPSGCTVRYRWTANDKRVGRGATLRLPRSLATKRITVRVTIAKHGGWSVVSTIVAGRVHR